MTGRAPLASFVLNFHPPPGNAFSWACLPYGPNAGGLENRIAERKTVGPDVLLAGNSHFRSEWQSLFHLSCPLRLR